MGVNDRAIHTPNLNPYFLVEKKCWNNRDKCSAGTNARVTDRHGHVVVFLPVPAYVYSPSILLDDLTAHSVGRRMGESRSNALAHERMLIMAILSCYVGFYI